jgi:S1-C subfamily serine protease
VAAVDAGSPADEAGVRPGDILADYAERGPPTFRQMLQINEQFADEQVRLVVLRSGELINLADRDTATAERLRELLDAEIGPMEDE